MKIIPVILSGGSGTRLWPLSREKYPKQYLSIGNKRTLLQETIIRLDGIDNVADPIIICNSDHRFLVAEQCKQIKVKKPIILLEKTGRNTAPAIAAAALYSLNFSKDILLVLSADNIIGELDAFHDSIKTAFRNAQNGKLVLFGITPKNANPNYGYIETSKDIHTSELKVEKFIEKPDLHLAKSFIDNGNYLWNSGMFMFQASILVNELNTYAPKIVSCAKEAVDNSIQDLDFIRLDEKALESSPSISIDYALMEKSVNLILVPLDALWSDVGSWSALYEIGEKDRDGNLITGDVLTLNTSNSYINSNHHIVVTIGTGGGASI